MIVTLTLNPAHDRVMGLEGLLRVGELQRISHVREQAGGKGVDVARAVRALGGEVLTAGVLGGFTGRKFEALLSAEGLMSQFLWSEAGETRQCHILLAGADQAGTHPTEINETGFAVPAELLARLLAALPAGPLVMSGSLPPGLTPAEFHTLLRSRPGSVVDTSGPALRAALESGNVSLIKPNRAELSAITHPDAGLAAAQTLYAQSGSRILLTLGEGGAALIGKQTIQATAPQIKALNPVGSGDCLLGAFVWAEQQGFAPAEALRWGVAAGSANAQAGGPHALERGQVEALLSHPTKRAGVPSGQAPDGCCSRRQSVHDERPARCLGHNGTRLERVASPGASVHDEGPARCLGRFGIERSPYHTKSDFF